MDFDYHVVNEAKLRYTYVCSKHVLEERVPQRVNSSMPDHVIPLWVQDMCEYGTIINEIGDMRYIENDGYTFPCLKMGERSYLVKTVLDRGMAITFNS